MGRDARKAPRRTVRGLRNAEAKKPVWMICPTCKSGWQHLRDLKKCVRSHEEEGNV